MLYYTKSDVHIENLSTACFIAALRRFASRRGMPSKICSNNGCNFIGVKNKLKELH